MGPGLVRARDRVRSLRAEALRQGAGTAAPKARLDRDLRRLVVIGSSSRGGSSIFAEVLRRTLDVVHLRAEINPFLRLHGCAPGPAALLALDPRGDGLDATDPAPPGLWEDLAWDCGRPAEGLPDAAAQADFGLDLACRLSLQWPQERFELDEVQGAVSHCLARLQAEAGWAPGEYRDGQHFHALLLARLRRDHPAVDPFLYDLDRERIAECCPEARPPRQPPAQVIEEPPFVTIGPWQRATAEELRRLPLLVKTPGNAYRLPWLAAALPQARLDLLHLTRNVAASVNGLFDGWRHVGFHAHHMPGRLHIGSYSEVVPGGRDWWKFDLPPGWPDWTARRLEEVCAFQWRSAHTALLAAAEDLPEDRVLRLRFEDFLGDPPRHLARVGGWLGAALDHQRAGALSRALPAVMATHQPRHRRWFGRADLLEGVLTDPDNLSLMVRLGYELDPDGWL